MSQMLVVAQMRGGGVDGVGCWAPCVAGPTDDEAGEDEMQEKLLYFFPPSTSLPEQLDHVQFCEGLLDFARYTMHAAVLCVPAR